MRVSSHQRQLVVFHWSLNDSKSPQVSRTILSILADLNCVVVCIVLIVTLISNSSNYLSIPVGTVPSASIIIGITVILMFHSFYFSNKVQVFISLFLLFHFPSMVHWNGKIDYSTSSLFFPFFLLINSSDLPAGIR